MRKLIKKSGEEVHKTGKCLKRGKMAINISMDCKNLDAENCRYAKNCFEIFLKVLGGSSFMQEDLNLKNRATSTGLK
jgi:hypothetical protein